ncbi:MAG: alpha/beta hydrolase [Acidimicrobiia bacterium]|nr:alpha/beta hydrolase [Acidimicrobiia bacterium]
MTATSHSFESRGHRHAYELHGDGDQLFVYLHGLLMDRQMNRALAETLAAAGYQVALLDFLGHGDSDKPLHAGSYRMDAYAEDVLALLDHLGADQAVVGGVSLGADVSLHLAVAAPERVRALVVEMPVLEWAVPAAALLFTPMLLTMHYAARPAGWVTRQMARIPRTGNGALNSVLALLSSPPEVVKAVLHGILTGPVAPTVEERRALEAPTLVIAHTRDLIHPFSDAESLTNMLPAGQLAPARSMTELRLRPARLTRQIVAFVDAVWAGEPVESAG